MSMCSPSLNSKRKIQAMKNLSNKKPAHKIFFASMMKFFAIEAVFAQINVSMQALECLTLHVAMWTQHWGDYACQAQRYATIDLIMCFGMHFIRPMLQMWWWLTVYFLILSFNCWLAIFHITRRLLLQRLCNVQALKTLCVLYLHSCNHNLMLRKLSIFTHDIEYHVLVKPFRLPEQLTNVRRSIGLFDVWVFFHLFVQKF